MSNQTLIWASFIVSWLSLLFMKNEDVRRFMPVGLVSAILTTIVMEIGIVSNWWLPKELSFPFANMSIFSYGAYLVGTIWIFKYTYERFLLYITANAAMDLILSFLLVPWFVQLGLFEVYVPSLMLFSIATLMAVIIYGYHMWQTGDIKLELVPNVKPAAVKPLIKDPSEDPDEE
jgi:hypothetical protein